MSKVDSAAENSMSFRAKMPNILKKAAGKKVSPQDAIIERTAGFNYAMAHKDPQEIKETVLRETMIGNYDFVAGINDALAKTAAKKGYKNSSK